LLIAVGGQPVAVIDKGTHSEALLEFIKIQCTFFIVSKTLKTEKSQKLY